MAVKTDVLLLAESGDVTVARRTAFYTYGKFDVILPEGQEQEETDSRLTDGYIARAHDGNVGRFDFGFARADATVNIDAGTSDLETQIDSAELRSEGDVFFEGDIGAEGFNGFVPGVDFDTGDIVSVTRWGSRLSLPVTDIEYEVSDSGGPRASRVHVSGQLIHDAASRRRSNDEIRQQIAAEKRERLRQVGAVDQKATQAKDTADSAKDVADQAKRDVEDNRTYIDEQLDAAGAAVEQGRQYLLQMEEHVTAGNIAAGLAEDLAGQAAAAAAEAIGILDQLDPLRDDVAAAHAEVVRLHGEASQLTDQAAGHVLLASQHASDAQGYAQQALEHEAEGRRQATAALNAAGAAQDSTAAAQGILDDADAILSQVSGHSEDANQALSDAEGLLANAGGQGKSLGDVLLEVAQKHQETLTAHSDILDLHGEVLQKHSEAIRYVAAAAAQASMAAQHAAQAAQEALNVAADAASAADSAAYAADEAAQAAENNRQAIGKLEESDGKLQEADQKLQQQIDVLEESQRLLAKAVQILAGAVAQAAAAAMHAAQAADAAGEAAGSALEAIDAMQEAQQAYMDTKNAVDTRQDAALAQLKAQAEDIVRLQNESMNMLIATAAGVSWPGVEVYPSNVSGSDWQFSLPDSAGALVKIEWWNNIGAGNDATLARTNWRAVSGNLNIHFGNTQAVMATWAKAKAVLRTISEQHTTDLNLSQRVWTTISSLTVTAHSDASRGYLKASVTWFAPTRGPDYISRIMVDGVEVARDVLTSVSGVRDPVTHSVEAANISLAAGKNVIVQVWSDSTASVLRRVSSAKLEGNWIETQ